MKLKELLKDSFEGLSQMENNGFPTINGNVLEQLKDSLIQTDEFKDVDELIIMKFPSVMDDNKKILNAQSYKVSDSTKFKKRCYLYSISLTPEVFDPNAIYNPVKNGACISPTIYNPSDFKIKKKIVLDYFIEDFQDNFNSKKKELHDLLDDVLNNPDEYRVSGDRGIIVRGIFEEVESEYGNIVVGIGDLKL